VVFFRLIVCRTRRESAAKCSIGTVLHVLIVLAGFTFFGVFPPELAAGPGLAIQVDAEIDRRLLLSVFVSFLEHFHARVPVECPEELFLFLSEHSFS
jgi:hypothetical protein